MQSPVHWPAGEGRQGDGERIRAGERVMGVYRDQLFESLTPGNGAVVVANLAYYFSTSMRSVYDQAEARDLELRQLRQGNEILHVLSKQALMYQGVAGIGYPEAVLVQAIGELAERGGLLDQLEWACQQTSAKL
jgi:hypothetical protein